MRSFFVGTKVKIFPVSVENITKFMESFSFILRKGANNSGAHFIYE